MRARSAVGTMCLAVLATLGLSSQSVKAAPIIIDTFTVNQSIGGGPGGSSGPFTNSVGGPFIGGLGTGRAFTIERTAGASTFGADSNLSTPGYLSIQNGTGTTNTFSSAYTFNSPVSLLSGTIFDLLDVDNDIGLVDLAVEIYSGNTLLATLTNQINGNVVGQNYDFTLGVNLANVTGISLVVSSLSNAGAIGTDTRIGEFSIRDDSTVIITEVPEPATLATLGLMSMVGGYYTRRNLKNRAVAQS